MKLQSLLAGVVLALGSTLASAAIVFTPTGTVELDATFDPSGALFAPGAYTSGELGVFTATGPVELALTYLGQESGAADGVALGFDRVLTERSRIGDTLVGDAAAGEVLPFLFFGSNGGLAANGGLGWLGASFAVLDHHVTTRFGTFDYLIGFDDSRTHGDYDDFVIGLRNVSAVPEPGALLALSAGLAVIGLRARRRAGR
ncbi:PEP-CTERM sorting domain-containing protein [Piscinibacter gummiphilus]|uniref:PEP-CTERM protein-sorting domain-containing protein n=1 Tax=Piscinibacter gummiphilus TaxID=946333 RepID=A0A1W6L4U4_9BURK|nr:PEP-CTERM sorting domain-containing protein [Piscinibacter gummiphilus]ARN19359.1 hypothetical protein A4W93_05220 [Piscinibacter gummiphilus]GLS93013.1 hypothetical protein GCM10007918_03040 [Piscinibacter gummiphilus]